MTAPPGEVRESRARWQQQIAPNALPSCIILRYDLGPWRLPMYWFKTPLGLATVISILAFFALTVDTLRQMPARTHSAEISAEVVEGKRLWQHYDCNDCHTIFGIGGYYAPDVTKTYSIRGQAWLKRFLADPHSMYARGRQMPNFRLSDRKSVV